MPPGRAELEAAIESYRPELEGTPAARDAARFLLLHPPLPWSARPGYCALAGAGVTVLPLWARRHLALPRLPLTERAIALPLVAPRPASSAGRGSTPTRPAHASDPPSRS